MASKAYAKLMKLLPAVTEPERTRPTTASKSTKSALSGFTGARGAVNAGTKSGGERGRSAVEPQSLREKYASFLSTARDDDDDDELEHLDEDMEEDLDQLEEDELMDINEDEEEDIFGLDEDGEGLFGMDEDEDGLALEEEEDLDVEQLMYDDDGELIDHGETAPTHEKFTHEELDGEREMPVYDTPEEEFNALSQQDLFYANYFTELSPEESKLLVAASQFALPNGRTPQLLRKSEAEALTKKVRSSNYVSPLSTTPASSSSSSTTTNATSSTRNLRRASALKRRRWKTIQAEFFNKEDNDEEEEEDDDDDDVDLNEFPAEVADGQDEDEDETDPLMVENRAIVREDIAIAKQFAFFTDREVLNLPEFPLPLAPTARFSDINPVVHHSQTDLPPRATIESSLAAHWERNGIFASSSTKCGPGLKYEISVDQVSRAINRTFPLPIQRMLYPLLADYADVYFAPRPPNHRPAGVDKSIDLGRPEDDSAAVTDVVLAHALSHLMKTKLHISRNDSRLEEAKKAEEAKLLEKIGLTEDGLKKRVKITGVKENPGEPEEILVDSGLNKRGFKRKLERMAKVVKKQELAELRKQARESNKATPLSEAPIFVPLAQTLDEVPDETVKENVLQRDQGFTRPTILFIVPMKCQAYAIAKRILELLPTKQRATVFHMKRFEQEFGDPDGLYTPRIVKPADYRKVFWGNNDDCFKLGISLGRKSVKLCVPVYGADIIIASPLGLKLLTGNEGDDPRKRDTDFLSSIEICGLLDADLFSMQNFQHLSDVMLTLNTLPRKNRDTDFSRIRSAFLDGFARFFRQTLVVSNAPNVMLQNLFMKITDNRRGRYRIRPLIYPGVMSGIRVAPTAPMPVRHIFMRQDDLGSITEADERRFQQFVNDIWPKIKENAVDGHVLFYVSNYFDFVRIRNYLNRRHVSFAAVSEFTGQSSVSRARHALISGKIKFFLTTDRFHFFNRFRLKSIKTVVWYGLPTYPNFYSEVVSFIDGGVCKVKTQSKDESIASERKSTAAATGSTSIVIYSKHDAMQLERIVGTQRSSAMLTGQQKIHVIQQ